MSTAEFPLSPADFEVLCQVIAKVARTSGLLPQDAEDFAQHAHVHLMERRYAPVTAFSGRSSLRTYLTVVVRRLLLDWRNARFGKWRPSAEARRLGPAAIALDRLMSRDGYRLEEAVAMLKGRPSCSQSAPLRRLASKLPRRVKAQAVAPETFEGLAPAPFTDPVEATEASLERRLALGRLRRAFAQLSGDDRRLLELRYRKGLSVRDIAAGLGMPDKPLYRRMERIVAMLRRAMDAADGAASNATPIDRSSNVWLS
jgi:RNA polymerase sigma factor for flagellar operon FliA